LGCFQFREEQTSGENDVKVIFLLGKVVPDASKIVCSTESTKLLRLRRCKQIDGEIVSEGYARSNSRFTSGGSICIISE